MEKTTCQNCRFAHPVAGHHSPLLICTRSPSGRTSFTVTNPLAACDRFKPAPNRTPKAPNPNERLIPVKGAPYARIDARDYHKVAGFEWCARYTTRTCYAFLSGRNTAMHRLILDAPAGLVVDHIDHNGLNNTRKNLRLCTHQQNKFNQLPRRRCSSEYKGVSKSPRGGWRANIWTGRHRDLGRFKSEIDAAKAYDKAAKKFFKEFAYLNFPEHEP